MNEHLVFQVNTQYYAISIQYLQEITHQVSINPVAGLRPPLKGVINLRNKVIPVFSFSEILNINSVPSEANKLIVFNYGGSSFAGVVEKVNEVIRIKNEQISDAEGASHESPFIKGFYRMPDGQILQVLDTERIMEEILSHLHKDSPIPQPREGLSEDLEEVTQRLGQIHQKEQTLQKILSGIGQYLNAIKSGDVKGAEKALLFIKKSAEEEVIDEIKKLVDNVHNSLNEFKKNLDTRLRMLAESAFSGTASDIEKVITQTEEATTKTISIIEKQLNAQNEMVRCLDELTEKTRSVNEVTGPINSLRQLIEDLNMDLMEALVAQQIKDLTGQILKKTLTVIQQIEKGLEDLIEDFGLSMESSTKKRDISIVRDQNEVDALLAQYDL